MKKVLFLLLAMLSYNRAKAQFAPQAPLTGHEGIILTDDRIVEWASAATFERGPLNIADAGLGYPTYGDSSSAAGYPDGNILSLGDGGHAIITFAHSIRNGNGPDFAVFENGFSDPLNDTMAYLEFAFVEVSSDGVNFTRFPATCNIQDTLQNDNFTYSDAQLVNNLAGKYKVQYGTPFDLEELAGTPGLDIDNITHIKLADVIGSIDPEYASYDKYGHVINDPYPSVYPSGGFDLDAVGVLNSNKPLSLDNLANNIVLRVFPNPATDFVDIHTGDNTSLSFRLMDLRGRSVREGRFKNSVRLSVSDLSEGFYLLQVSNGQQHASIKLCKY